MLTYMLVTKTVHYLAMRPSAFSMVECSCSALTIGMPLGPLQGVKGLNHIAMDIALPVLVCSVSALAQIG